MFAFNARALLTPIIALAIWPNAISGQCPVPAKPDPQTVETIASPDAPQIRIQKILFQGNTGLTPTEQADIAAGVQDKAGTYEPKWLEEFEYRLLDGWQERGYFKAKVTAKAREISGTPEEKTFVVTAHVESGRRYSLGEIHFLKSTQFSSGELRSMFPLQTGELFNIHRISEGMEVLRKAYGSRGFIDFTPVPTTIADEANGQISVDLELEEGRQYRISATYVLGMDPVSTKAFLLGSGLEPGDTVNPANLETFQEKHESQMERFVDPKQGSVCLQISLAESPQN